MSCSDVPILWHMPHGCDRRRISRSLAATSGNARLAQASAASYERPDSEGVVMRENPCVPGEMAPQHTRRSSRPDITVPFGRSAGDLLATSLHPRVFRTFSIKRGGKKNLLPCWPRGLRGCSKDLTHAVRITVSHRLAKASMWRPRAWFTRRDQAALAERRAFEVTAEWADCDVHHIRCNVNVSRPIS
jgi:hypothetical protein